jgi:hypothetical protein
VHGAVLGVAQALAAVGVQEMGGGYVAGADGGIGLERNAELKALPRLRVDDSLRLSFPRKSGISHRIVLTCQDKKVCRWVGL